MPLWLKTAIFTCIMPGTATVLIPFFVLQATDNLLPCGWGVFRVAGVILSSLGVAIYLSCARNFVVHGHGTPAPIDAPKRLVVQGLYRYTRNPMYVGMLSIVAGEALYFGSFWLVLYGLFFFAMFHAFVVLYEEPTLERLFGESYRSMREEIPRWVRRER